MPAELVHQSNELHRIQVENCVRAVRVIAGQRENIFKTQSRDGFQVVAKFLPVFADAGDVNVRSQTTRARGCAHSHGVLTGGAACVTRDAAGDDPGSGSQLRGDFQQPRFARNTAGHNLHDMAEPSRL